MSHINYNKAHANETNMRHTNLALSLSRMAQFILSLFSVKI